MIASTGWRRAATIMSPSPLPSPSCWPGCMLSPAADLEMDLARRTVRRGGQTIDLQPREFRLLEFLMRNQGRIVTRTMLLERVWDFHFDPKTSVVETHISRLRAKIDRPFANDLIHTTRGAGYSIHNGG